MSTMAEELRAAGARIQILVWYAVEDPEHPSFGLEVLWNNLNNEEQMAVLAGLGVAPPYDEDADAEERALWRLTATEFMDVVQAHGHGDVGGFLAQVDIAGKGCCIWAGNLLGLFEAIKAKAQACSVDSEE